MQRVLKLLLASLAACLSLSGAAHSQSAYPAKPIRILIPFLAGGPVDTTARVIQQALARALGQPVVIENKTGADGAIAAQAVIGSPPDGYTLFFGGSSTMVSVPVLRKSPPFDPVADFTAISLIGRFAFCMFVHPDVPAKTVAEFVDHARANPGKLNFATSNLTEFMFAAQLMNSTGISMVRVPYKGAAQAIPDLVAGRVQLDFVPISAGLAHARDGRLRMLATVLPKRIPVAPEVPTMAEAGMPGVTVSPWQGIFGPPKLPREIVERLARELSQILQSAEVRAHYDRQGFQPETSSPEALTAMLRNDIQVWGQIVREAGIAQD
ncbi:MAG: tripartite tricarboxylate transporter substrate binding protein [Betaproteobacteria bacterium]|nr:tripartite tricarboxylate transporter substrate binding protein [Betaproteobacteria bacterium]